MLQIVDQLKSPAGGRPGIVSTSEPGWAAIRPSRFPGEVIPLEARNTTPLSKTVGILCNQAVPQPSAPQSSAPQSSAKDLAGDALAGLDARHDRDPDGLPNRETRGAGKASPTRLPIRIHPRNLHFIRRLPVVKKMHTHTRFCPSFRLPGPDASELRRAASCAGDRRIR
jgi:hypothetical protein